MTPIDPEALRLAAERVGLSEAQVADVLSAFRYVSGEVAEPEWRPVSHMTMVDCGLANWEADGTTVTKVVQTPRTATGWGKGFVFFTYGKDDYDTYGEARAAELRDTQSGGQVVSITQSATP